MILQGEHIGIGHEQNLLSAPALQWREGMCIALMGLNGAGKSSLMKSLCGLLPLLNGKLQFKTSNGEWVDPKGKITYVAPHAQYPPQCRVDEFVYSGKLSTLNWKGMHQIEDETGLHDALELTSSLHLRNKWMHTLSDGERQRINVARALMSQTRFLALDEPTSFLDIKGRKEIMRMIYALRESPMGILYSSHDMNVCFQYSTHIWLIKDQQLITGTTSEMSEQVLSYFGED